MAERLHADVVVVGAGPVGFVLGQAPHRIANRSGPMPAKHPAAAYSSVHRPTFRHGKHDTDPWLSFWFENTHTRAGGH